MADRERKNSLYKSKTRANASKQNKESVQDTSTLCPYICEICKGNDSLRSILQNDEVKTFINKISDITEANESLSDQINILKNLDLHIQHMLIEPKQLVHANVKLNKLDLQFKEFEQNINKKTDELSALLSTAKPAVAPLSPTLLKKLDDFTSVPQIPQTEVNNPVFIPPACPPTTTASPIAPVAPYTDIKYEFMDENSLNSVKEYVENDKYEPMGSSNRETSYYGDSSYKYGKKYHPARRIPSVFQNIGNMLDQEFPKYKGLPKTYLVSKYMNGNAYCPAHSDNEPALSPIADIYTFSIGANRKMKLERIHGDEVQEVELPENSLLIFSRSSQCYSHWKHSIPVDESVEGPRFSVTVRVLEQYNLNSTRLYGDSNTAFIKFGVGPKTLGRWCPGERIRASRVGDIPSPEDIDPVRNMIIHTGVNDLRDRYNPLTPAQIVTTMEGKCAAILRVHPQMR